MKTQFLILIAASFLLIACGEPSAATAPEASATASTLVEEVASTGQIARGSFEGRSDHVVTGDVRVVESGQDTFVLLGDDFTLDGAPDPKLGFGNDGTYDTATTFTILEREAGAQAYRIPDSVDAAAYNELVLWCDEFSVPLGVASLE